MFHLKLNNESGMVLLVALVVTLLSTALAGSFMSLTIYESKHSIWQKHKAQSLLLAEAGVEKSLYYLNSPDDPDNPWVDEAGEMLPTPVEYAASLSDGQYDTTLYSTVEMPWLPANSYLVRSEGILPQKTSGVSCLVRRLPGLLIPAALAILDSADPEIELDKFQSAQWTVNGRDMDDPFGGGLPGIAVANFGDDIVGQLGNRLDQVTGADELGNATVGVDAILEDDTLPQNLDAYANYFEKIAIDISGNGTIPHALQGDADDFQVLYADLGVSNLKIAGNTSCYGVLVLDGDGVFEMAGNAEWNGVIICARSSNIHLKGGGNTPAHIYGALLIADGLAEMNGTADIVYSSDNAAKVNDSLLLYQVYSWCGGWGVPLGSDEYYPICSEEYADGTEDAGIY